MGTVTTTYSHAAPYIRRQMIDAVAEAIHCQTKRDRLAGWARVGGMADALRIMAESEDQTPVEGIPDLDSAPIDGLRETLRFVGVFDGDGNRRGQVSASGGLAILSNEGVLEMLSLVDAHNARQERSRA